VDRWISESSGTQQKSLSIERALHTDIEILTIIERALHVDRWI
jgi:hypothetical protein